MKSVECEECGDNFSAIGTHWHHNPSHRKNISKNQMEILTGILMGDGHLRREEGKNPYMRIKMTNNRYLEYIDNVLGVLSTGVRHIPSEENIYVLRTRAHPMLSVYTGWYSSGVKVFPDGLDLSPIILKHWHCCDGSLQRNSIIIGITNEISNKKKLSCYFTNQNLPTPIFSSTKYTDIMRWRVNDSQKIMEYMGEPVNGFEYKWGEQ